MFVVTYPKLNQHFDIQRKLFSNLSYEAIANSLISLSFTLGKFPKTREGLISGSSRHQDLLISDNYCGGDFSHGGAEVMCRCLVSSGC